MARLSGRYEEALALYLECGLHHGAGACLRALGDLGGAIGHLTLTSRESPHYREACREVAAASIAYGSLPSLVSSFVNPFAESGPRSDSEIPAFLDLAELYWGAGERRLAERCLTGALRLDPSHETAQLMQLTWKSELARERDR